MTIFKMYDVRGASEEYYTPIEYVEAARRTMGGIDLDPASNPVAQLIVQATVYYTKDDNGLKRAWEGRVFCNPPYGKLGNVSQQAVWSRYLLEQIEQGHTTEAILLVNTSPETKWHYRLAKACTLYCETDHRIMFRRYLAKKPKKQHAMLGSSFFYFGPNGDRFIENFLRFGPIHVITLFRQDYPGLFDLTAYDPVEEDHGN